MMQTTQKGWFNVDEEGLKALQKGRDKTFIINELTQNAFDEDTSICDLFIKYDKQKKQITIQVTDDSPEGFRDITHAYTLFANTYKRSDPTKRGRFNMGEKQVVCMCTYAEVITTKGTIIFDENGEHELPEKRKAGSVIKIILEGSERTYNELLKHAKTIIPPTHINYIVNQKSSDITLVIDIFVNC